MKTHYSWIILAVAVSAPPVLAFALLEDGIHPIVRVKYGTLLGKWQASRAGQVFASFEGIPFAAPAGRFEPPLPSNWSGTLDARSTGSMCPQSMGDSYIGVEDCLFLNVYMPKTANESSDPLAVMVWIHGGGFMIGAADLYGPKYLMDEGVVLVTTNYRLGALGFLNSGDGNVGGNLGLKDQVMALRWVQENIGFFNGNPQNVTIFGESAGGGSVSLLQVSPAAKGLFQRAISQSGSALCTWAFNDDPETIMNSFATAAGCSWPTTELKIQCLKHKSTKELLDAQKSLTQTSLSLIGPTIDSLSRDYSVLPDYPKVLIADASSNSVGVPTMIGHNSEEGRALTLALPPFAIHMLNLFWNTLAPKIFVYESYFKNDTKAKDRVSSGIRKFYFDDKFIDSKNLQNFTDAVSDIAFLIGIKQATWGYAKNNRNVYSYLFKYTGNFTIVEPSTNGPTHVDELQYIFNPNIERAKSENPGVYPNGDDDKFSVQMTKLWANFAKGKTGNLKMQDGGDEIWAPLPTESRDDRNAMVYYILDKTSKMGSEDDPVLKRWAGLKDIFKGTPLEFLV